MKPDGFLTAIALAVAAAFAAPWIGTSHGALHMGLVTDLGVALVFFLHGAAVSPAAMKVAVSNWRLHAIIQLSTYALFPLIGLAIWSGSARLLGPELRLGFFFLCVTSSTISSSVAMTALARGNVPGAIFNATLSGLMGMVLTPLMLWLVTAQSGAGSPVLAQVGAIVTKLLLPFIVGQLVRGLIARWLERHRAIVGKADQAVIVAIVYTAFCDAAASGVWTHDNALALILVTVLCAAMLVFFLAATTFASRALGFGKEDEIAAVFCGSKKSLANGAPIAKVIFAGSPALGLILVPLLIYHQIQLVVCAVMARRYAARS